MAMAMGVPCERSHARCDFTVVPPPGGCLADGNQPAPGATSPRRLRPSQPRRRRHRAARSAAGSAGGPRGGGATAAARGEPEEVPPDPVIQARTDCWMAVEHQKDLRGLDQRIAYVDKCVADQKKSQPKP